MAGQSNLLKTRVSRMVSGCRLKYGQFRPQAIGGTEFFDPPDVGAITRNWMTSCRQFSVNDSTNVDPRRMQNGFVLDTTSAQLTFDARVGWHIDLFSTLAGSSCHRLLSLNFMLEPVTNGSGQIHSTTACSNDLAMVKANSLDCA